MRFVVLFMLALTFAFPVLACEEFERTMDALEASLKPPRAPQPGEKFVQQAVFMKDFYTKEDLVKWSETSTPGGGHAEEAQLAGKKLLISYRGYTSGVKSSDAAIYVKNGETWTLVKSIAPVWNTWIRAETTPGGILFRAGDTGKELLLLTPRDLQ